jgi:antitoxin (DNA-binding transcriptional repressor) of toxin-antitoxin stability system
MLTKIKRFLTSPWRAAALEDFKTYVHERLDEADIPTHPGGHHSAAGCRVGDRLDILIGQRDLAQRGLDSAPSFVGAALRDGKLGEEIVTAVKKEAVAKLAPALSEEYAKMLNQIAWTLPPPRSQRYDNPGMALTAYDERHEVYHVRVEIPQLNYEMKVANL